MSDNAGAGDRGRFRGCLLGLAIGDALGTTVEFRPRGTFMPVRDIVGGGPFGLAPGEWTDDTSMALCLADSLLECDGFDAADQMMRYVRWRNEGYRSSNGDCFDIGTTVARSLQRYCDSGEPLAGSTDPDTAGNGCIMRLAPVPMFYFPDVQAARTYAVESSRTTHGAQECLDASRLFAGMLCRALAGMAKRDVLLGDAADGFASEKIAAIARGSYLQSHEDDIRGTGYVVATLEAALWCFARADTFEAAVLTAANLGDDADTTAAVCGQLAATFYGDAAIPKRWLDVLTMRDEIASLAERLWARTARSEESRRPLPS